MVPLKSIFIQQEDILNTEVAIIELFVNDCLKSSIQLAKFRDVKVTKDSKKFCPSRIFFYYNNIIEKEVNPEEVEDPDEEVIYKFPDNKVVKKLTRSIFKSTLVQSESKTKTEQRNQYH
mgnify:CR=1 FL=1